MKCISLMSGTSLDGIDALLCDVEFKDDKFLVEELDFLSIDYPKIIKDKILRNLDTTTSRVDEICELNFELAYLASDLVQNLLKRNNFNPTEIDYISSHGQTLFHITNSNCKTLTPSTLQIGDACVLSAKTKIKVINNFRSADIANGGQGAPLVPIADHFLFRDKNKLRIMVNIGGISNFSILDPSLDYSYGYDVGPGNVLIDTITNMYFNLPFDKNGDIAKSGTLIKEVFEKIIKHDYFKISHPKSTGRETFNQKFIDKYFENNKHHPIDILNTLTNITAFCIINEAKKFSDNKYNKEIVVCGGGSYNSYLISLIKKGLKNFFNVVTLEDIGYNSKSKECVCFAILGYLTINGISSNIEKITGGVGDVILGSISKNF